MTGIILLNKPDSMTSFVAANRVKRILKVKKTGHTGTLDPMATGVLPIALSNATRFIELLPTHNKAYKARVRLGITTDTLDITGKVLTQSAVNVTEDELLSAVNQFSGEILQTPPMYSAISKDGVRLYELARKGIEIERDKRSVTIYNIEMSDFSGDEFTLSVECSAGTYIRSLCDDIGKSLGCGAVMTSLVRTKANGFVLSECITLEELQEKASLNALDEVIIPIEKCLSAYGKISVTQPQANRFHNGGALSLARLHNKYQTGIYRVFSPDDVFLGLGEITEGSDTLDVKRVFVSD